MLLFPCEAVWPCTSVCWEPFDYWFNFNTSIWSVPISYFFLIQPERLNVSRNSFISSRLSNLLAYNCSLFFCDIGYNFCSFISKFVYLGPLFLFLVTLSNSLPILFVFLKNQPLVLFIFSIFGVSILFISTLIFIVSFLLLTSGFVFSSFYNPFRCTFMLFIWDFSCFLK